jgi:hypothetical protein
VLALDDEMDDPLAVAPDEFGLSDPAATDENVVHLGNDGESLRPRRSPQAAPREGESGLDSNVTSVPAVDDEHRHTL